MTAAEHMHHLGTVAGEAHKRQGRPMQNIAIMTEWAEAHRRQVCRNCANNDNCTTWGNIRACPSTLRREYKRSYRRAYSN